MRYFAPILALAAAAAAVFMLPAAHAQAPETVLIQGQLLDDEGAPIVGLRQYRVRFFDAETDGAQLGGDIADFTQVSAQGLFAIPVIPPAEVLSAPAAWYELALDSGTPAQGVGPEDVFPQRIRVHSVPFALKAMEATGLAGEAFVMVETTADPAQNGANLLAAYAEAAALNPHGEALGKTNRATVIVPPGNYDLGTGQLVMDTPFVDIEGLSADRVKQYIFGTSNGPGTGVLRQTADNVRIENLFVHCTRAGGGAPSDATAPAAYFPDSDLPGTVVRNCRFLADDSNAWSMRVSIEYAGTYENSTGGILAFGGLAAASGTFTGCTGGNLAFGGGFNGVAGGTFTHCTGGNFAFGGGGTASGTFNHCAGGDSALGGGFNGVASGSFTHCTAGTLAFGGGIGGTAPGGEFYYCVGAADAFTTSGSPAPVHLYCVRGGTAFP